MNQPRRSAIEDSHGHIEISLKGTPAEVYKLLQGLTGTLPASEPEQLFVSRAVAVQRSGMSEDAISAAVRSGRLVNHGSPRKMLLSLAEIRALRDGTD